MFDFLTKKQYGKDCTKVTLKISGMHCASCAINIDDALEELEEIVSSNTNYAQSKTIVKFKGKINLEKILSTIKHEGYSAELELE